MRKPGSTTPALGVVGLSTVLLLSSALQACQNVRNRPGLTHEQLLVGSWAGTTITRDGLGELYMELRFKSDGMVHGAFEARGFPEPGKVMCIEFEGNWSIDGSTLIYRDLTYSNGHAERIIRDHVLTLDSKRAIYRSLDDGMVLERHRIAEARTSCSGQGRLQGFIANRRE